MKYRYPKRRPPWYRGPERDIGSMFRFIRAMSPGDAITAAVYSTRRANDDANFRTLNLPNGIQYTTRCKDLEESLYYIQCMVGDGAPIFLYTTRVIYYRGTWYSATMNSITEYNSQFCVVDVYPLPIVGKKYSHHIVKQTIRDLWRRNHIGGLYGKCDCGVIHDNFEMVF